MMSIIFSLFQMVMEGKYCLIQCHLPFPYCQSVCIKRSLLFERHAKCYDSFTSQVNSNSSMGGTRRRMQHNLRKNRIQCQHYISYQAILWRQKTQSNCRNLVGLYYIFYCHFSLPIWKYRLIYFAISVLQMTRSPSPQLKGSGMEWCMLNGVLG